MDFGAIIIIVFICLMVIWIAAVAVDRGRQDLKDRKIRNHMYREVKRREQEEEKRRRQG